MTGEELKDEELMSLFEASRWAPSSGNGQPWELFMQKEIQKIGIVFLSYLLTLTRAGLKMRLY
jgi:nitroreductase family protein